jgi:hypothetical protein
MKFIGGVLLLQWLQQMTTFGCGKTFYTILISFTCNLAAVMAV